MSACDDPADVGSRLRVAHPLRIVVDHLVNGLHDLHAEGCSAALFGVLGWHVSSEEFRIQTARLHPRIIKMPARVPGAEVEGLIHVLSRSEEHTSELQSQS